MGAWGEEVSHPLKKGLPQLLNAGRPTSTQAKAMPPASGDRFWGTTAVPSTPRRLGSLNSMVPPGGEPPRRASTAPSSSRSERPGGMQIMQWIERELVVNGLQGTEPSVERVRVFSSAFNEVIDMLPSYRPFLLSVQKEYDGLIQRMQADFNALAPLEGRLKTLKAESFSFVGESMTWFQMEISCLRKRVEELESQRAALTAERDKLLAENTKLQEGSEKDRYLASESHLQNMDILKHLERTEKQVEFLRKQEKELHGTNKELERKLKEKENRVQTVEDQLDEARDKLTRMVAREDFEALREEIRHWEVKYKDLEDMYAAKQKDYLAIVEIYSKFVGQTITDGSEMRPLTPRPRWQHCRGLLDPEGSRTMEKADLAQDLLGHLLVNSRMLLSAYGLAAASQKSAVFRDFVKHPMAAPLSGSEPERWDAAKLKDQDGAPTDESTASSDAAPSGANGGSTANGAAGANGADGKAGPGKHKSSGSQEPCWLPPDADESTPPALRHEDKVLNMKFSRKKAADFLDSILQIRVRHGVACHGTPFLDFMMSHLRLEMTDEQAREFAINIYAAVRRYSVEPDFLAYLLLLVGRVPDQTVRDNKGLCPELLRIFTSYFEAPDGARCITKQKFFYGLREVLQNKDPKMWQDLVTYFPAGGPDVLVNFEWLLLDDYYVLSPIVYALRLQHLEESVTLADRLDKMVRDSVKEGTNVVYEVVEAALKEDAEFGSFEPEDYARGFGTTPGDLKAHTEQDPSTFIELIRHGEFFHQLFFPQLPSDDSSLGAQGDMQ